MDDSFCRISPFFETSIGKNNLHIRVPVAFLRVGWPEIRGKNRGCPKAINGHLVRGKSTVFLKTGHNSGVFSTGTETSDFAGVSRHDPDRKTGKGALIGLIFDHPNDIARGRVSLLRVMPLTARFNCPARSCSPFPPFTGSAVPFLFPHTTPAGQAQQRTGR